MRGQKERGDAGYKTRQKWIEVDRGNSKDRKKRGRDCTEEIERTKEKREERTLKKGQN